MRKYIWSSINGIIPIGTVFVYLNPKISDKILFGIIPVRMLNAVLLVISIICFYIIIKNILKVNTRKNILISKSIHNYVDRMRNVYNQLNYSHFTEHTLQSFMEKISFEFCEDLGQLLNQITSDKHSHMNVKIDMFESSKKESIYTIAIHTDTALEYRKKELKNKKTHPVSEEANSAYFRIRESKDRDKIYNGERDFYCNYNISGNNYYIKSNNKIRFKRLKTREWAKFIYTSTDCAYKSNDINSIIIVPIALDTKIDIICKDGTIKPKIKKELLGFVTCDYQSESKDYLSLLNSEEKLIIQEIIMLYTDNLHNFYEKCIRINQAILKKKKEEE